MSHQLVSDKVITLEPSRNLLSFNKFDDKGAQYAPDHYAPTMSGLEINHQIINNQLAILIAMLQLIIPAELIDDGKTTFEIRTNHLNYMIRVKTKNELLIKILLSSFLETKNCCYLEINGCIYRNGLYRDILSLEYNPQSFRQPDDSIREYIIQWLQKSVSRGWETMIFFGGECTMLGKILSGHSKSQYFYTDFPSIYNDILHNYKNPNVELIDYKTWKISRKISRNGFINDSAILDCCYIINTGYQGMGENLSKEICKVNASEIYVISCNQESWAKDLSVLSKSYNLLEQVEIRTNYSVWIYKLSK